MTRNRIVWRLEIDALEEGVNEHVYHASGWLDDSDALRWALARALQQEGTHNGWYSANEAAAGAELDWSEDDAGEKVTVALIGVEGAL